MKPLNLDNKPCSPISSNCVIWQGPDISCINICKGDTVSDVVAALATELCTLLDQTNVTNYDLTCLGITACGPQDFQALIQLLINKICELQGIPAAEARSTSACPDCLVSVAPCFVQNNITTMQLIDYVQMIANKICDLIAQIADLQQQINDLDIRVTILENTPPPTFVIPSFTLGCTIGSLPTGSTQAINVTLEQFINNVWCGYYAATGSTSDLLSAVNAICILDADLQLTTGTPFSDNPNWIESASYNTVADAINNIWVALCDVYNAVQDISFTVEDTTTVNLTYTAGTLSAQVQDTGWINLNGFAFMASNPNRPQCRRIGNEVHFRGYIVVPMGNLNSGGGGNVNVSTAADDYVGLQYGNTFNTVQSGNAPDSCKIVTYNSGIWAPGNDGIGLSFNLGNSVIPSGILAPGQNFDGSYALGGGTRNIVFRTVTTTGNKNAALHSLGSLSISSTGILFWGGPLYDESYQSATQGWEYSGIGRSMISNPIAGENIPTFTPTAPSSYNADAAAVYSPSLTGVADTWAFSQNAGHADQMGGFIIRIDGMRAFIAPCDPVIPTPNPCS